MFQVLDPRFNVGLRFSSQYILQGQKIRFFKLFILYKYPLKYKHMKKKTMNYSQVHVHFRRKKDKTKHQSNRNSRLSHRF